MGTLRFCLSWWSTNFHQYLEGHPVQFSSSRTAPLNLGLQTSSSWWVATWEQVILHPVIVSTMAWCASPMDEISSNLAVSWVCCRYFWMIGRIHICISHYLWYRSLHGVQSGWDHVYPYIYVYYTYILQKWDPHWSTIPNVFFVGYSPTWDDSFWHPHCHMFDTWFP